MNSWRKRGGTHIYSIYKQKVTSWRHEVCAILLLIGVLLLNGCTATRTTLPDPAPSPTPVVANDPATPTTAAPTMEVAPMEAGPLRILSPQNAGVLVFPSPTPRPASPTVQGAQLVKSPPTTSTSLTAGVVQGELRATAGVFYDNTYFDLYEFEGQAGQIVTLRLRSSEFDTNLALLDPSGAVVEINDDYEKASSNSQIVAALSGNGTYQVLVNSFDIVEGAYELDFQIQETGVADPVLTLNTLVQGWLVPGDSTTAEGLWYDEWQIEMPAASTVVWVSSDQFDPKMEALDPAGTLIVQNGDKDLVARDFDAWVVLVPSDRTPPGSLITIRVLQQGEYSGGGHYQIKALPVPLDYSRKGTVTIRPIIVKGADGLLGSEATESQIRASIEQARTMWQQCGLEVVIENDEVQTISVPGLEYTVQIESPGQEWTLEEDLIMFHPSHALPDTGIITLYFVRDADARTGIAYPTTRYGPQRGGLIIVADTGVTDDRAFTGTVAHEIGHLLGLNHPDLEDGDPENDTAPNIMFAGVGVDIESPLTEAETAMLYTQPTPIQCVVARATPHFVRPVDGTPLVPPEFQRTDRVLTLGTTMTAALTTRDALASDETEQFLDVYHFHGEEGDIFKIQLSSEAFDTFLLIENQAGEVIDTNDDGTTGTDSELVFKVPETGDYLIGVTSVIRSVGSYTLTFEDEGE